VQSTNETGIRYKNERKSRSYSAVTRPSVPPRSFSPAIFAAWMVGFLPLESAPIWIPAAQIHYGATPVAVGIVASMPLVMAALARASDRAGLGWPCGTKFEAELRACEG
jgi:hypothetical protein